MISTRPRNTVSELARSPDSPQIHLQQIQGGVSMEGVRKVRRGYLKRMEQERREEESREGGEKDKRKEEEKREIINNLEKRIEEEGGRNFCIFENFFKNCFIFALVKTSEFSLAKPSTCSPALCVILYEELVGFWLH